MRNAARLTFRSMLMQQHVGMFCSLVRSGITAVELDTQDQYFVGLGGLPNADGVMEFDAAVMDGKTMSYGAVLTIR